jgi:hypothetical protein
MLFLNEQSQAFINLTIARHIFKEISHKSYMKGINNKCTSKCHNNFFMLKGHSKIWALETINK